jgi:predicted transcriptional regulator
MVIIYMDSLDTISKRIKTLRKFLGLSQSALAIAANISQSTVARVEKDIEKLNPSYSMMSKIVAALNEEAAKVESVRSFKVYELMHKKIIYVKPEEKVKKAIEIMRANDFSQIPVINNDMNVVGTVYQKDLLEYISNPKKAGETKISEIMGIAIPQVDKNAKVIMIKPMLEAWGAVLVSEKNKVVGIITVYDLFKAA